MKNKKKGLFAGFCSVFAFTAEQNVKGKGFKLTSVLIGLVIMAVCAAIPIIMAETQKPDGSEDDQYGIEENLADQDSEDEMMDAIVVIDQNILDEHILQDFISLCGYEIKVEYSDINVEKNYKEFSEYCTKKYSQPIGMEVKTEKDKLTFSYYLFEGTDVSEDFVDGFAQSFEWYYKDMKYVDAGVDETDIEILNMPSWTNSAVAGEKEREMGVVVAQMLVPAIFSLLLFMMTILHGQSITKVVMAEKSSKLMEVLLTSVRPYGLIAGKIVSMATMAILQFTLWVVLGLAGFVAGDYIAKDIYSDYNNIIFEIIDLIRESGTGFTLQALILAIIMTVTGFVMYCVWAGFIASAVDKVEDVSTAMSLFQIPPMIGFMVSYIGSLLEMDTLIKVSEYIPVISPFVAPADVLMGKMSFVGGLISYVILLIFTVAMILVTGKVYKGKIFNRK